jgi:N-acyl-D-amino-acid deacylase
MRTPSESWRNLMMLAGSPDRVPLVGFRTDTPAALTGKTSA